MVKYNPFDKDITDLAKDDLEQLIEGKVTEGWYIEYLQDFPDSSQEVAKSISSFANSYGGWFVIGVKVNSDHCAEEITGFDLLDIDNPKERLENIIRTQLLPVPFFEIKLVWVDNNRAVTVVYIEEGADAPYVTREGKIYRRAGDNPKPVEETDRDAVQKLVDRSYELKDKIEVFSHNPFIITSSKEDEQLGFMEMYLYVLPFDKQKFAGFYSSDFFDELKQAFTSAPDYVKDSSKTDIVFNNVYTSFNSYILRHSLQEKTSDYTGLTIELFENGNAKVILPIPKLPTIFPFVFIPDMFQESENYKSFLDRMSDEAAKALRIINGFKFFVVFTTVFHQYCNLLKKHNFLTGLNVRIKFTELNGALVFFDNVEYLDLVNNWGYPTCYKDVIEIPGFREGALIPVKTEQESVYFLIGVIFEALGFSLGMAPENLYGLSNVIKGLSKSNTGRL